MAWWCPTSEWLGWVPSPIVNLNTGLDSISSHRLRQEFPQLRSRLPSLWTRSGYVGTAGKVSEATIRRDIEAQKGRSAVRKTFRYKRYPTRRQADAGVKPDRKSVV